MKINFNKRMLWSIIGLLVFGVFSIIAYEGIGFRINSDGTSLAIKLHNLANVTDSADETLYGTAVAGIVLAWLAILLPFASAFIKDTKIQKYLGYGTLFLGVAALALTIASEAHFLTLYNKNFDDISYLVSINKGASAGVLVLVVLGGLIGISTSVYSYLPTLKTK